MLKIILTIGFLKINYSYFRDEYELQITINEDRYFQQQNQSIILKEIYYQNFNLLKNTIMEKGNNVEKFFYQLDLLNRYNENQLYTFIGTKNLSTIIQMSLENIYIILLEFLNFLEISINLEEKNKFLNNSILFQIHLNKIFQKSYIYNFLEIHVLKKNNNISIDCQPPFKIEMSQSNNIIDETVYNITTLIDPLSKKLSPKQKLHSSIQMKNKFIDDKNCNNYKNSQLLSKYLKPDETKLNDITSEIPLKNLYNQLNESFINCNDYDLYDNINSNNIFHNLTKKSNTVNINNKLNKSFTIDNNILNKYEFTKDIISNRNYDYNQSNTIKKNSLKDFQSGNKKFNKQDINSSIKSTESTNSIKNKDILINNNFNNRQESRPHSTNLNTNFQNESIKNEMELSEIQEDLYNNCSNNNEYILNNLENSNNIIIDQKSINNNILLIQEYNNNLIPENLYNNHNRNKHIANCNNNLWTIEENNESYDDINKFQKTKRKVQNHFQNKNNDDEIDDIKEETSLQQISENDSTAEYFYNNIYDNFSQQISEYIINDEIEKIFNNEIDSIDYNEIEDIINKKKTVEDCNKQLRQDCTIINKNNINNNLKKESIIIIPNRKLIFFKKNNYQPQKKSFLEKHNNNFINNIIPKKFIFRQDNDQIQKQVKTILNQNNILTKINEEDSQEL
jgi:hypothetical protein